MYKLKWFFCLLLILPIGVLTAQSNEVLDTFLDQSEADLGTSIWLVLLSEGQIPADSDVNDALDYFSGTKAAGKITDLSADRPIEFKEFAYVAMEVMDLPGGMMYAIIPSPRYAAREFQYRGWMPGRPKSGAVLSPWEVTTSLSEIIAWKEARK
jgi:hypothetical protein